MRPQRGWRGASTAASSSWAKYWAKWPPRPGRLGSQLCDTPAGESGETGRRAGLRIQWAKSPWGFDSPLSHQHRDRLRERISGLRGPCAKAPRPGYLTRRNLVVVGVQPPARVNISRVSLLTIFMSRGSAFPSQVCMTLSTSRALSSRPARRRPPACRCRCATPRRGKETVRYRAGPAGGGGGGGGIPAGGGGMLEGAFAVLVQR